MSLQLINLNPDLKKLRDDGYEVEIRSNYLLVNNIPYVNSQKEIKRGMLASELTLAGDKTVTPNTHVVYFAGDHPCHKDGSEIEQIKHSSNKQNFGPGLIVDHSFSCKPKDGYKNYHDKMDTYAMLISGPAQSIDADMSPKTFAVVEMEEEDSVFNYLDTASSRAEINMVTQKLALEKVAIVGLGGTGSYVFDLIAKTPIKEIHLFDGDRKLSHNAFRSPGAPSVAELREQPKKVDYFKNIYSKMRRNIFAHGFHIDSSTIEELADMSFVFLCLDGGKEKEFIVGRLEEFGIQFIDVGMGLELVDGSLGGLLRITASTHDKRDHVKNKNRIPFSDGSDNNEYSKNIQIADLNALNAALAVIKWKKIFGFYRDYGKEHFSIYTIDVNTIINEDQS